MNLFIKNLFIKTVSLLFYGISLGINLPVNLGVNAQIPPIPPQIPTQILSEIPSQNLSFGRWQVKFPLTEVNPDVEVAITTDGRIFYIDKAKGEAIEIMTLLERVSTEATIPGSIKIIDIEAQAKAEEIARQNQRLQAEAKTVLSTIFAAQSEYFTKNKEFAAKLADLGFGSEITSPVFDYKIEVIEPKFITLAVAIAKEQNLTFIGISYLTQNSQGKSGIASLVCQGTKTNQKNLTPRFIKVDSFIQEIKCPIGSAPI